MFRGSDVVVVDMDSKQLKLMLGMAGVGAVLAMGGLTVTFDGDGSAAQAPAVAVAERADDSAEGTTVRGVPETSFAVPPITTAPYTIPTGEPQ